MFDWGIDIALTTYDVLPDAVAERARLYHRAVTEAILKKYWSGHTVASLVYGERPLFRFLPRRG